MVERVTMQSTERFSSTKHFVGKLITSSVTVRVNAETNQNVDQPTFENFNSLSVQLKYKVNGQ